MYNLPLYLENAERQLAKAKLWAAIQEIYAQKARSACPEERRRLNRTIDERVIRFNRDFPKGPNYLDLHWMTKWGAVRFVKREMRLRTGALIVETGVGNNSARGVGQIREAILALKMPMVSVTSNRGVLVLRL